MKKVMALVVALLACHATYAQYFCSTPDTELHYVNYDESGQSVWNETATVKNVTKEGSELKAQYYAKIVTNKAKNNTSYTLLNWTYDGTNTVCDEDLMYGVYIDSDSDPSKYSETYRQALQEDRKFKGNNRFTLSNDAKGGQSMPDRSYQLLVGVLKNEINISGAAYMGTEEVKTTAGTFQCLKVSYLKRTKVVVKTTTLRVTEWYAKGIGLVKSEAYDTKGKLDSRILLVKIEK